MKRLLFAALLLISSVAEAAWIRVASESPVPADRAIFVATYLHDGPIDPSMPGPSHYRYFLTLVYDLEMIQPIVYSRSHEIKKSVVKCQEKANAWARSYARKKRLREVREGYHSQDPSEEEKEE